MLLRTVLLLSLVVAVSSHALFKKNYGSGGILGRIFGSRSESCEDNNGGSPTRRVIGGYVKKVGGYVKKGGDESCSSSSSKSSSCEEKDGGGYVKKEDETCSSSSSKSSSCEEKGGGGYAKVGIKKSQSCSSSSKTSKNTYGKPKSLSCSSSSSKTKDGKPKSRKTIKNTYRKPKSQSCSSSSKTSKNKYGKPKSQSCSSSSKRSKDKYGKPKSQSCSSSSKTSRKKYGKPKSQSCSSSSSSKSKPKGPGKYIRPRCKPRNGSWGKYSEWSKCSATCDGMQTRVRKCDSPAPYCGGKKCYGKAEETRSCGGCCPVDGQWGKFSPWCACSATCEGTQTRVRKCNCPEPSCGGKTCEGKGVETRSCNDCCKVDGKWGPYCEWSKCSATCEGTRTRTRACIFPKPLCKGAPCTGKSSETEACGGCCPVDGKWGPFSEWSKCSATCEGQQTRTRSCIYEKPDCKGNPCDGPSTQTRDCGKCCPGEVSSWSPWSCEDDCGYTISYRTRTCSNDCCDDVHLREERPCFNKCCPHVGRVGPWGPWQCEDDCGITVRSRTRDCLPDPHYHFPSLCPPTCKEHLLEEQPCYNGCCPTPPPVKPYWGDWGKWICEDDCGITVKKRTRECIRDDYYCETCEGHSSMELPCFNGECPDPMYG